eukprot:UN27767
MIFTKMNIVIWILLFLISDKLEKFKRSSFTEVSIFSEAQKKIAFSKPNIL